MQFTDLLSSCFLTALEHLLGSSEPGVGLSSLFAGSSSDETERGEGLREEEEDKGSGEPSEELSFLLEEARAGDWEQWMTEGLSLSSLCEVFGKLRLA